MSVHVNFLGRFGNCIFQYTCARLFAEKNNFSLLTEFKYENILATTTPKGEMTFTCPAVTIDDTNTKIFESWSSGAYTFNGYFQIAKWYYDKREHIKNFFKLPVVELADPEDIVIHIRLGDYRVAWGKSRIIDPSWYFKCLEMEKFKRLHIVTEEPDVYLDNFKKYDPIMHIGGDGYAAWTFLRGFERAIISNSSYAWTSTFLGNAKKVYDFARGVDDFRHEYSGGYAITVDGKFEGE